MSEVAVEFQKVSKSYPVYDSPGDRLTELVTLNRVRRRKEFWALRDVSLQIRRGETFCIVGENGAGKSTFLQLIAGILQPTSGEVRVDGRVSALLELGSGFNPEFTGRDNVYLSGAILGFSSQAMDAKYRSIEEFAEIGPFIDQPVKTYSSGMIVRLAFAVAIHVDPDILLVDEALAVGDIYFRQRCMRKVHELRTSGVTILFVSHSIGDVKALGDRTLWLHAGAVRELGPTDEVVSKYLAAMVEKDAAYLELKGIQPSSSPGGTAAEPPPEVITTIPNIDHRHGDRRAEVIGIAVLDDRQSPAALLNPGSSIVIRISVRANDRISQPNVGFIMRNHLGIDFAGTNSLREGFPLPPMSAGDLYTVDFHVDLPVLYPSHFSFSPAIADGSLVSYKICDWIDNAITLQMGHAEGPVYGYIHLPCRVQLNSRLSGLVQVAASELG
ncbi:MAG: ABC transporter ATP-binding protein [Bryobacteraceae bacterium]|nr:ABC transporter ATP-binding protein [Bryobacteraceae bacterium]